MSYDDLPSDSEPATVVEMPARHLQQLLSAAKHYAAEPKDRASTAKLMLIRALEIAWDELPSEEVAMTFLHSAGRRLG